MWFRWASIHPTDHIHRSIILLNLSTGYAGQKNEDNWVIMWYDLGIRTGVFLAVKCGLCLVSPFPFTLHVIQRKTATFHILVLKSQAAPNCVERRAKCHNVSCLKTQNKSFSPSVSTKENDILLQAYINKQLQLRYKQLWTQCLFILFLSGCRF